MPSISYNSIYKRALSRIKDLELATYTEADFYDSLKEWLHSSTASPLFRKKFQLFSLDDEIMRVTFELTNSVDDDFDKNFVINILAKGIIINYFPSKLESTRNIAFAVGGSQEKVLLNTYSKNMERLKQLEKEYDLELSRHGWYFGEYGESNG